MRQVTLVFRDDDWAEVFARRFNKLKAADRPSGQDYEDMALALVSALEEAEMDLGA
jgi:hypothetical protein